MHGDCKHMKAVQFARELQKAQRQRQPRPRRLRVLPTTRED
jgi:hypothetical protein